MEKTKSCFICENLIGEDGEICPVLAERYSKVFDKVTISPFSALSEIIKANSGCLEHRECKDRLAQKKMNDLYATKVADMFGEFLTAQESGKSAIPPLSVPAVNIENITINITR